MPPRVDIVRRDLLAQLKNGDTFTLSPLDSAPHLLGSVIERVRFTHTLDVSWEAAATGTDLWETSKITNPVTGSGLVTKLVRGSGNFVADGFGDGDDVEFLATEPVGGGVAGFPVIQSASPDTIIFDSDIGAASAIYGEADFDGTNITVFAIFGKQDLTAVKFKFGLVENSEAINFISKIDGTEQSYYVDGIGLGGPRSTAFVIGESSELFKGWQTGTFKARYVSDPQLRVQRFEIEHEFIILPYLKVDDATTVFELSESLSSLKYAFQCELRTVLSDPNTGKIVTDDYKKGSVATFGENFNGYNSQYSIDSVNILDSGGNAINALEVGTTNSVTVVINSADATFVGSQPFVVYHSYLPTADVYVKSTQDFEAIWLYESKRHTLGTAPASGTIITNVYTTFTPTQVTLTFDITYSTAQQALLTNADEFVLAIGVGDNTLSTLTSDKTVLEILQAAYTKNTDVPDLMSVTQLGLFDHPTDFITGAGFTDYIGAVEDGILVEVDFSLDLALSAVLETLNINFVAYNPITEDLFVLQTNAVDITSQVTGVPEGVYFVQEININGVRGFTLAVGDQFNFFKLTTAALSGTDKPYNLQFGIKADWREWLPLPAADPVFYDNSEQLNGLNKLISNYTGNGYEIRIMVNAQVSNGTVTTEYNFSSPEIQIFNYDLSAALDWVCNIETFDVTETNNFSGNISTSENTLIKVTFDSPTIVVSNTALYWGIIRIEPQNNPSLPTIEPLSTVRDGVLNQLIPIAGQTTTEKSIESGNLVLKCLVDYTTLVPGTNYKPSSRFGLGDSHDVTPTKLKEDGTGKDKEDNDSKALDP